MKKNTIKKLIAYALSLSMLMVTLTACTIDNSDKVELQELPETLTIDCEIPEEYPETVSVYHIDNFDDFNVERAIEIFLGDEEYEFDDTYNTYLTESNLLFGYLDQAALDKHIEYLNNTMFSFTDREYCFYYENYVSRGVGYESVEEALDDVQNILDEILTGLDYRMYSQDVYEYDYGSGNLLETPAELLIYRQYIDDIPISIATNYNKDYLGLFYTQVYYTLTDGLLTMYCDGPKVADEELYSSEIISPNTVINTLIDIHNDSLIDNFETIIEVELQYTVRYNDVSGSSSDKENLMIYPVWSIKTAQTSDPENTSLHSYYGFDAITGELWAD